VADAKGVVLAFTAFRERCQAAGLFNCADLFTSTGQNLMRVSLVTDIPDDPVCGCLLAVVQGDGEFDTAQAGTEMTAAF